MVERDIYEQTPIGITSEYRLDQCKTMTVHILFDHKVNIRLVIMLAGILVYVHDSNH